MVIRRRPFVWLCACAVLLAGCATVPMAAVSQDIDAKKFAPPPGQAHVYVFRGRGLGMALAFQVILDGKVVGSIAPDTYHLMAVDPGDHTIAASSNENAKLIRFRAAAGQNYFFEIDVRMGWVSGRVGLEQVDEEAGRRGVLDAKRAESL
jgi:hypothetical protein